MGRNSPRFTWPLCCQAIRDFKYLSEGKYSQPLKDRGQRKPTVQPCDHQKLGSLAFLAQSSGIKTNEIDQLIDRAPGPLTLESAPPGFPKLSSKHIILPDCSRSNRPSDNIYYQERMYLFADVIVGAPKGQSKAHPTPFAIRRELIKIFWLDCIPTQPEVSGIGEQYSPRGVIPELKNPISVAGSSEYGGSTRAESPISGISLRLPGDGNDPGQYTSLCSQPYDSCEDDDVDVSQNEGPNEVLRMEMGQQNGDADGGDVLHVPQARSSAPKALMQSLVLDKVEALKVNSATRNWASLDHSRIYVTSIVNIEELGQKRYKSHDRLWSWSREEKDDFNAQMNELLSGNFHFRAISLKNNVVSLRHMDFWQIYFGIGGSTFWLGLLSLSTRARGQKRKARGYSKAG